MLTQSFVSDLPPGIFVKIEGKICLQPNNLWNYDCFFVISVLFRIELVGFSDRSGLHEYFSLPMVGYSAWCADSFMNCMVLSVHRRMYSNMTKYLFNTLLPPYRIEQSYVNLPI